MQSTLHVGIIMDGNGRWAAARGLPRIFGHRAGVEAARRVVEAAPDAGVGDPHALRVLKRQLAAAAGGSRRADAPDGRVSGERDAALCQRRGYGWR